MNESPIRIDQQPQRIDPWAQTRTGRWIVVSSILHLGLLIAFASVSLTVIRSVEKIAVKIIPEREPGIEELEHEGAPSLEDLAGLLEMAPPERLPARLGNPKLRDIRAPQIPKIGGVGPKLGRGPSLDAEAPSLSFGLGGVGGLGGGFGDYVGSLRKVGLDLVLVIDSTKSMQFVLDEVKEKLTELVEAMHRMVPTSRVGIVVYRDHGDEYLVKWSDLSFHTSKLHDFLTGVKAWGGGDWEEAVLDALDVAIHDLTWRKKSKKIVVLVGGSPPHPQEVAAVQELARTFRAEGGHVNAIDVTHRLHLEEQRYAWEADGGSEPFVPWPMPRYYAEVGRVYAEIADAGGGSLAQLDDTKKLMRDVLELTFGARWKIEMEKYLNELS